MNTSTDQLFSESLYIRRISRLTAAQLANIDQYLQALLKQDAGHLKKTHFFHKRFENIYLTSCDNPDLNQLIAESLSYCAELLEVKPDVLKIGYWFNLMEPGHTTTLHRHDDLDELISGVVYLTVPDNSGDLILQSADEDIVVKPITGHYIFFDPATPHSVSENKSSSHRLSIGMNIGMMKSQD